MRRFIVSTAILVLLSCCFIGQARSEIGLRLGRYTDSKSTFVGAEFKTNFAMIAVNPNAEYVFVDNAKFATANLDAALNVSLIPMLSTWVGGGLGIMYSDPDGVDSTTDSVVNILAGVGLSSVPLKPYLQMKFIAADNDQFVVGVGIRF